MAGFIRRVEQIIERNVENGLPCGREGFIDQLVFLAKILEDKLTTATLIRIYATGL